MATNNFQSPTGYSGQPATTKRQGVVRFATLQEAVAGTANNVAVTPADILGNIIPIPITVPLGGTGLTSITDHGVMVGSGTAAVTALAVGTTGQVLIGATGADPAFGALGVNSGLTNHGLLVGGGNAAMSALAVGANGEVLIGLTGADPAWSGSLSLSGAIQGDSLTATSDVTSQSGDLVAFNGDLDLGTAGNKIKIATGSNASVGTSAAMTAGTITINTTAVTASSIVFVSMNTPGGTTGNLSAPIGSIVPNTSFVINSTSNTDTSTVNWLIIN